MQRLAQDKQAAETGFVSSTDVCLLTGAAPGVVAGWLMLKVKLHGRHYHLWTDVCLNLGDEARETLGLPLDATAAVLLAHGLRQRGQMYHVNHPNQCGDPSPVLDDVYCTRPFRHLGEHRAVFPNNKSTPNWGPTIRSLQHMKAAKAKKLKKENSVHPYALEPDTTDPNAPELPHVNVLSRYMGRAIKLKRALIDALPEYSWRVPVPETMRGFFWKANRNVCNPNGPKEWWRGEHVILDGELGVRWCCIQFAVDHPEKILPDFAEGQTLVTEDQFVESGKK